MVTYPHGDDQRRRPTATHKDASDGECKFFHVPRSLFYLIVAAMPTMLITGTTFVVMQTFRTADLERRASLAEERMAKLDGKIDLTAQTAENNRNSTNDLVNKVDLRLTRIEAQLTFLVSNYTPPSAAKR